MRPQLLRRMSPGTALRTACAIAQFSVIVAESWRYSTASSAMQCRSNLVSSHSLPKTGVFGIAAGDFREFQPGFEPPYGGIKIHCLATS